MLCVPLHGFSLHGSLFPFCLCLVVWQPRSSLPLYPRGVYTCDAELRCPHRTEPRACVLPLPLKFPSEEFVAQGQECPTPNDAPLPAMPAGAEGRLAFT